MHRQGGVLLILVVGFVLCLVDGSRAGAPSLLRVRDFMTPVQFTECGLTKLSEKELGQLDAWLNEYTLAVFQVASSQNGPRPMPKQERPAPPMPPPAGSSVEFKDLEGTVIVASDGQFLGKITKNEYSTDSIANKYGTYGSKYSTASMRISLNSNGRFRANRTAVSRFPNGASERSDAGMGSVD